MMMAYFTDSFSLKMLSIMVSIAYLLFCYNIGVYQDLENLKILIGGFIFLIVGINVNLNEFL